MYLTDMLALSHVPRWAIVPHRGSQNVGDHTFRVLVIFTDLAIRLKLGFDASDVLKILMHDLPESRTGDIPTPAKAILKLEPEDLDFAPSVGRMFRLADMVEAFTFIEKHGCGAHALRVSIELRKKITELAGEDVKIVNEVIDAITFESGR